MGYQEYTYDWSGDFFDDYINGVGELSVFIGDSLIEVKSFTRNNPVFYGAIQKNNIYKINGDRYVGELKNNLFHGKGILIKENNEVFSGEFRNGVPNGTLNYFINKILRYSGSWKDGKYNGYGKQFHGNGQTKEGIWINGKISISEKSKLVYSNSVYSGYLLNNKPEGEGTMVFSNGYKYKGSWNDGKFSGDGVFTGVNNDTINGNWHEGLLEGYAEIINNDFWCYGFWSQGLLNGQAYYIYQDSSLYFGNFKNNKKEGYGELYFKNDDSYKGEWKDDKFNGIGHYSYSDGSYYKGTWENGLLSGMGTIENDSCNFTGEIKDGIISGYGEVIYVESGDKYEGYFEENTKSGLGVYSYNNGNHYEGEFKNGLFNGNGVFTYKNGSQYQGEFYNGKIYGEGSLYLNEGASTIIYTAVWDGESGFPQQASILFPNGDLYEGDLENGFPSHNGKWTTLNEREANVKIDLSERNTLNRANSFYKNHKESINLLGDVLGYIEIGAIAVRAIFRPAVTVTGPIIIAAHVGYVGIELLNAASSGIDSQECLEKGDTIKAKEAQAEALTNLAFATAAIVAPMAVSKSLKAVQPIAKKTLKPLLQGGKTFGKHFTVKLTKNGSYQKSWELSKKIKKKQFVNNTNIFVKETGIIKVQKNRFNKILHQFHLKIIELLKNSSLQKVANLPSIKTIAMAYENYGVTFKPTVVSLKGKVKVAWFPDFSSYSICKVTIPKKTWEISNRSIHFEAAKEGLKKEYLKNPEKYQKLLKKSNKRTVNASKEYVKKIKSTADDLEHKMIHAKKNGNTKEAKRFYEELKRATRPIVNKELRFGEQIKYLDENEMFNRQLKDIKSNNPNIFGFTWHHQERGNSLLLVADDVHNSVSHLGGFSLTKSSLN